MIAMVCEWRSQADDKVQDWSTAATHKVSGYANVQHVCMHGAVCVDATPDTDTLGPTMVCPITKHNTVVRLTQMHWTDVIDR